MAIVSTVKVLPQVSRKVARASAEAAFQARCAPKALPAYATERWRRQEAENDNARGVKAVRRG